MAIARWGALMEWQLPLVAAAAAAVAASAAVVAAAVASSPAAVASSAAAAAAAASDVSHRLPSASWHAARPPRSTTGQHNR